MKFNLWRTSARFSQAIQLRNKVVLLFLSLLFFGTGSLTWLTSTNAFSNLARLIFVPAITSISPATPTASSLDQNVTVFGSGFQSGLTVTVTFPGGGTGTLSDSQIQSVTSTSFVMVVTLNATGTWSIRANNPGGGSSNTFSFNVQAVSPPSI
ncbi:MAG: hypothetical protein HOP19_21105, partial [Acidobacteria bacterium]|nr:hypothetical protein [Acidobacteriota bacterium]